MNETIRLFTAVVQANYFFYSGRFASTLITLPENYLSILWQMFVVCPFKLIWQKMNTLVILLSNYQVCLPNYRVTRDIHLPRWESPAFYSQNVCIKFSFESIILLLHISMTFMQIVRTICKFTSKQSLNNKGRWVRFTCSVVFAWNCKILVWIAKSDHLKWNHNKSKIFTDIFHMERWKGQQYHKETISNTIKWANQAWNENSCFKL